MTDALRLLDASAFWRVRRSQLADERRRELAELSARGLLAASTSLLLEVWAGRNEPPVDPSDLTMLWITERAERRAVELQARMRAAHQHLGVPPMDYLVAAIAEDHGAVLLHYDADFERLTEHTDLATATELLAPLGSLP